jgi:hypothetical protein
MVICHPEISKNKPKDSAFKIESGLLKETTLVRVDKELDQATTQRPNQSELALPKIPYLCETYFTQEFEAPSSSMIKYEMPPEFDEPGSPCFPQLDSDYTLSSNYFEPISPIFNQFIFDEAPLTPTTSHTFL